MKENMRRDGFSYCGINLGSLGFYYVPERSKLHVWNEEFRNIEKSNGSRDGAQWHGNVAEAKTFDLFCYFEDVTPGTLEFVLSLFDRNTVGDLVFDERPWVSYSVRPYASYELEKYADNGNSKMYGTITFRLRSYVTGGVCPVMTIDDIDALPSVETGGASVAKANARELTGIPESVSVLPGGIEASVAVPITSNKTGGYINGGDAVAHTKIKIAGNTGTGGTYIYNQLTKQRVHIVGLTEEITSNVSRWLEIDSYTGMCYLTDGSNKWNGFQYHGEGFLQLAPSGGSGMRRNIKLTFTGNSATTTDGSDVFTRNDIGDGNNTYVLAEDPNTWIAITAVLNPKTVILASAPTTDGDKVVGSIGKINPIVLTVGNSANLTKFEIEYKHTFK